MFKYNKLDLFSEGRAIINNIIDYYGEEDANFIDYYLERSKIIFNEPYQICQIMGNHHNYSEY